MSIKIMSEVWQLDLTPTEKLVLLALADHADDSGVCWPSQSHVANKAGCSRKTVNEKIGRFCKPTKDGGLGLMTKDGNKMRIVTEGYKKVTVGYTAPCNVALQPSNPATQESNPALQPSEPSTKHQLSLDELHSQAGVVYSEYPRHVGKPKAIVTIVKALKKVGFDKLLNRTKLYSQLTAEKEREFIPYPATWYNQERYNDDPDEWMSAGGTRVPLFAKLEHQLKYERDPEKWEELKAKLQALKGER